jgi:hypothetical protein
MVMALCPNIRETSILAFEQIKREGILGAVQLKVYELLFDKGPMTAREVTWHFETTEGSTAITTYQPRLRELEALGVVRRVAERACRITARLAYEWDVTKHVPTAADRAKLKDRKAPFLDDKVRLARLFRECEHLFNEGGRSEDFYTLILFLEEHAA